MRLATAIRMGSLLIENPRSHDTRGCAIGMACLAVGKADFLLANENLLAEWPWLNDVLTSCPCCGRVLPVNVTPPYLEPCSIVFHAFDSHVFGDGRMTIEQLCDFIDSIDPTPRDEQGESEVHSQEVNTEKVSA